MKKKKNEISFGNGRKHCGKRKQEGHDGPVSIHWLIHKIPSYQTLHYLGTGLKHKTKIVSHSSNVY